MGRILTTAFSALVLAAPAAMADDQPAPSASPATVLASLNVAPRTDVQTCRTSKVFALVSWLGLGSAYDREAGLV